MDLGHTAAALAIGGLKGFGIALAWGLGSVLLLKFFLEKINREHRKLAGADLTAIDRMSGQAFEEYLEVLFDRLGYVAIPTERYDKGADLILVKEGVRTAVQAKCWTREPVGVEAIRAVVAAQRPYRCTRGIVVTNGRFTRTANQAAKDNNIELWDRDDLANVINTLNHPDRPLPAPATSPSSSIPRAAPPSPSSPPIPPPRTTPAPPARASSPYASGSIASIIPSASAARSTAISTSKMSRAALTPPPAAPIATATD